MKIDLSEYKEVWKALAWFIAAIVACRFVGGLVIVAIVLVAIHAVSNNKPGLTVLCYMFIPMLLMANLTLRGSGSFFFGPLCRICPLVLTLIVVMQSARRRSNDKLPIGGLFLYCAIAVVSSIDGWCPPISYLKIVNYVNFILGIYLCSKSISDDPKALSVVRNGLLAFAIFVIFGSIAVIPFPSIGYSMFISNTSMWMQIDDAAEFIKQHEGMKLYSGVTYHSQMLAPLTVACVGWVLLDMFFVERRSSILHLALFASSPILLFMTHSRIGLLGFVVMMSLIYLIAIPKANVERGIKKKFRGVFQTMVVLCLIGAVVAEIRDNSMTKWIRKTDDLEQDIQNRDVMSAITQSRQGAIASNMYDFQQNPLMGMGFQTSEFHRYAYQAGRISIFSAPIEKGLLPLMILGETGIVGGLVFIGFLLAFYSTCKRKGYVCTTVLMTVFLVLNMAEASFFSNGGMGGAQWVVLPIGGFVIDMIVKGRNGMEYFIAMNGDAYTGR